MEDNLLPVTIFSRQFTYSRDATHLEMRRTVTHSSSNHLRTGESRCPGTQVNPDSTFLPCFLGTYLCMLTRAACVHGHHSWGPHNLLDCEAFSRQQEGPVSHRTGSGAWRRIRQVDNWSLIRKSSPDSRDRQGTPGTEPHFLPSRSTAGCCPCPRAPPSSWGDIKDLTPAGAKLLADSHLHLTTAKRLVEEVKRYCCPCVTDVTCPRARPSD